MLSVVAFAPLYAVPAAIGRATARVLRGLEHRRTAWGRTTSGDKWHSQRLIEVMHETRLWSDRPPAHARACGVGSWLAARPPLAPLIAPGAADIRVVDAGIWEQRISYHVPDPPDAWYWTVA